MGRLKDEDNKESEWKTYTLKDNEFAYIKSALYLSDAMVAQFRQGLDALVTTYMATNIAPRMGFEASNNLKFDFDEQNKQIRIKIID